MTINLASIKNTAVIVGIKNQLVYIDGHSPIVIVVFHLLPISLHSWACGLILKLLVLVIFLEYRGYNIIMPQQIY